MMLKKITVFLLIHTYFLEADCNETVSANMEFSLEHDKFLLEAYFRSGEHHEETGWSYSMTSCHLQFTIEFPNHEVDYETFARHVRRLVERFHNTGSICRGKSPGRKSVLTENVLEDVEHRLRASPTKPLRKLSAQTDPDYGDIPLLFDYDNYDKCMLLKEKALFCTFTFTLEPLYPNIKNRIWRIIKNLKADPRNYRHDRLRHGICVPTKCSNITNTQKATIREDIESCYNKKYSSIELKGNISDIVCDTNQTKYKIDVYDIVIGLLFTIYIIFVIFATTYEGVARTKQNDVHGKSIRTRVGKILECFSLKKNWYRLTAPSKNTDYRKLRSVQGIRFYNMICVIFCHTVMVTFAGPVENPKYIENVTSNILNMFVVNGQYVVQTFFVISGWLLSFHYFQSLQEEKSIDIKQVILTLINRYIRLTPTLAAVLAFESTWLVHMGKGPQWNALVAQEYRNCRKTWWTNILYVNNFVSSNTMCLHQTWYLAADTQLFVFSLILLTTVTKIRPRRIVLVLGATMILGILIQGSITFVNNYDIVIRQYPELLYNMTVLDEPAWHDLFSTGYSNITGYSIGLTAGYLFYKYNNIELVVKKFHIVLWWILTFGLCIFIILIAGVMYRPDYKYTRLESAFYWAFGKNLFALGIAIAIFGFTQKIGWFARYICEWKAVQIFGRLTYSAYIIHVPLIRIRAGLLRYPVYINDYLMFCTTMGDVVLSYLGGTLLCLMVEMPISALQKITMPKTSNKRESKLDESLKHVNCDECNIGINVQGEICTKI